MSPNAVELVRMRMTQEAHMFDECVIQRESHTANAINEPVSIYIDDLPATKCGLDMRPGSERYGGQMTRLVYDATVRLPITIMITNLDRIKVTKRFGETLAIALVFFVVGPVQRGPSGIRLLLGKVEV